MPLISIYRDFLEFLDASGSGVDLWQNYERLYFAPHRKFLSSYWSNCIGLTLEELRERVESIKPCHYSDLLSLLGSHDLEGKCLSTLQKCQQLLHWTEEPTVYLMVGFFSPDGFVLSVEGRPVIGIGLERYRSFRNLPIILAHECCHYMQHLRSCKLDGRTLGEAMLREGMCILFSRLVVPDRPVTEHLGISRGRFNWLCANEELLWQILKPVLNLTDENIIQQYIYGVISIPDNTVARESETVANINSGKIGSYIGFRMAEELLSVCGERDMDALLGITWEDALKSLKMYS